MNGTVEGEEVFIPLDQIIGGRERAGFGWNMLMDCLAEGRGISLPAMSVAASKLTASVVGAYARIRKQFKVCVITCVCVCGWLGVFFVVVAWVRTAHSFLGVRKFLCVFFFALDSISICWCFFFLPPARLDCFLFSSWCASPSTQASRGVGAYRSGRLEHPGKIQVL